MRAKISTTAVNLIHKDMVVNLYDAYAVEKIQREEKIMILDLGALVSLAGRPWLSMHLEKFDCTIEDMVSLSCYQVFRFGKIDKSYKSILMKELPLMVRSIKGKDNVLKAKVYLIDVDVTFLYGKKTMEQWE